jgi:hypothetical protein
MEMRRFRSKLIAFLFPLESTKWLAVLRVGLGLQVVLYTLSLRTDWNLLFSGGSDGLISRDLAESILSVESPLLPRFGWLVSGGAQFGLGEAAVLWLAWISLFLAGCCLLVGFLSRSAAIIAWFLHISAVKSGALLSYGMDTFTTIGLFYLMLSPLPDSYSLDQYLWKSAVNESQLQGFFRRVLQLHLCIIYFFGGIAKCVGSGWWNGTSIWRALVRPPFNVISPEILVSWRYVLPVLGISICLLETGYPLFIWLKKTRTIWLVAVLAMHVTIGLAMGMYLFALILIVLNAAAFWRGFDRAQSETVSL